MTKLLKSKEKSNMKFNKKYDYLYKQMIANLPVTGIPWLRSDFTKWWERLGKAVDSDKEASK